MDKNKTNPLIFHENEKDVKQNPIYFMGDDTNSHEILITSDMKDYVRGDKLVVEFNGCTIYADLDQAIFINTASKIVFIRENKKLTPVEQREYLVLMNFYDGTTSYQGIQGRQQTFDYLYTIFESIDTHESLILAETVPFKDGISVYDFMKKCVEEELVDTHDFDIDQV